MKTQSYEKIYSLVLAFLLVAMLAVHAQPTRGGGGGGGFGGFGGLGGFSGGGNSSRSSGSSTTAGQYNNNGSVGSAVISVDPVTHNIMVIADEETSQQISNVIANLDAPTPQVLIKVVFVEVQDSKGSAIGVQGSYNNTSGNLNTALTNNFGLPQALAGATGSGGMYQFIGSDFTATVQALATAGKAQVLSRPSILARDGQQAQIVVGQSIYLPSGVSYTAVSGTTTTIPTINGSYQNVGIQLDVTPFIGANSLVQMILEPQITSIDLSTPGQVIVGGTTTALGAGGSSAVYAPNINKRSANTVVVTPDGQPVVIGGLIGSQKSVNDSKIPILGDIPLLGQLFKFSAKSNQKNELLIFLTPHIVYAPEQLVAMAGHETRQSSLITNSIPEQELNRFLDALPVKKN